MNTKIVHLRMPNCKHATENTRLRAEIAQLSRIVEELIDKVHRINQPMPWGFDSRDNQTGVIKQ